LLKSDDDNTSNYYSITSKTAGLGLNVESAISDINIISAISNFLEENDNNFIYDRFRQKLSLNPVRSAELIEETKNYYYRKENLSFQPISYEEAINSTSQLYVAIPFEPYTIYTYDADTKKFNLHTSYSYNMYTHYYRRIKYNNEHFQKGVSIIANGDSTIMAKNYVTNNGMLFYDSIDTEHFANNYIGKIAIKDVVIDE
jgi:hypothetical protein